MPEKLSPTKLKTNFQCKELTFKAGDGQPQPNTKCRIKSGFKSFKTRESNTKHNGGIPLNHRELAINPIKRLK